MEILQLKYFCESAKAQSFSKTAELFCVPPSAVSQSIRRLENELGTPLFDRTPNRLFLNAEGMRFYEKVASALSLLEEAREEALREKAAPTLKLCVNCNRRIVMQAVEKFRTEYPNATVRTVHFGDSNGAYDLVITSVPEAFPAYFSEELLTERLSLAVHRTHPLAKESSVSPSQLVDEPFVCLRRDSDFFRITEQICHQFHFSPHVAIETDDPFYLRRCVEMGLGISFVPVFSWQGQFSSEVRLLPLEGHTRTTYLCVPRERVHKPHLRRFMEILKDLTPHP